MAARKRRTGRARKVKTSGNDPETQAQRQLGNEEQRQLLASASGRCKHGFTLQGLQDSDYMMCVSFLETHTDALENALDMSRRENIAETSAAVAAATAAVEKNSAAAAMSAMRTTHERYPDIWTGRDVDNRERIKSFFLKKGTSVLLDTSRRYADTWLGLVTTYAAAVLMLENFDPGKGFDENDIGPRGQAYLTSRDILDGCRRSTIKFFKERIPCTCLDDMYAAARAVPKAGLCSHCRERVQRTKLWFCSRCQRQHYCSTACQRAHWPDHKVQCDRSAV